MRKDFFATPIYIFQIPSEFRMNWMTAITDLREQHPKLKEAPFNKGHKIRVNLFNDPRFLDFKQIVVEKATAVAHEMSIDLSRMDIEVDHAWASINKKNDFNEFHNHPNCDLSGTFYLRSTPMSGHIRFRDPREPVLLRVPLMEHSSVLIENVTFAPIEGTMLIFPSWLMHQVDPNPVDFDRISLSFNISFKLKPELVGSVQKEW
jgi:uncharacterized protein (TIGR02466 family)